LSTSGPEQVRNGHCASALSQSLRIWNSLYLRHPMKHVQFPFRPLATFRRNKAETFTMTNWMKSANWEPITGGLCNCEFLNYLDCAESPSKSWYQMPIFGEVGLNNQGRIAEKLENDRKVCVVFFHLDCSTFSLLATGFRLQRLAASEQS
jgi:hypothetical protein